MNNPTTLWIEHWEEVELIKKVMEENELLEKVISINPSDDNWGHNVTINFASVTMIYELGQLVQNEKIKSTI